MPLLLLIEAEIPRQSSPISIYAIERNVVATALDVLVTVWIDRSNRMAMVRIPVLDQRMAFDVSCVLNCIMLGQRLSSKVLYAIMATTPFLA